MEEPPRLEAHVAARRGGMHGEPLELLEARLQSVRPVTRLNLDREACQQLLEESAEEISALRTALG